jgi:hypothetical protein
MIDCFNIFNKNIFSESKDHYGVSIKVSKFLDYDELFYAITHKKYENENIEISSKIEIDFDKVNQDTFLYAVYLIRPIFFICLSEENLNNKKFIIDLQKKFNKENIKSSDDVKKLFDKTNLKKLSKKYNYLKIEVYTEKINLKNYTYDVKDRTEIKSISLIESKIAKKEPPKDKIAKKEPPKDKIAKKEQNSDIFQVFFKDDKNTCYKINIGRRLNKNIIDEVLGKYKINGVPLKNFYQPKDHLFKYINNANGRFIEYVYLITRVDGEDYDIEGLSSIYRVANDNDVEKHLEIEKNSETWGEFLDLKNKKIIPKYPLYSSDSFINYQYRDRGYGMKISEDRMKFIRSKNSKLVLHVINSSWIEKLKSKYGNKIIHFSKEHVAIENKKIPKTIYKISENAIMVDVDNTIANIDPYIGKQFPNGFDWDNFSKDLLKLKPRNKTISMIKHDFPDHDIYIITARPEEFRKDTEKWLANNGIKYKDIFLKKNNSEDPSSFKKRIIQDLQKKGVKFDVAFDDDVNNRKLIKPLEIDVFDPKTIENTNNLLMSIYINQGKELVNINDKDFKEGKQMITNQRKKIIEQVAKEWKVSPEKVKPIFLLFEKNLSAVKEENNKIKKFLEKSLRINKILIREGRIIQEKNKNLQKKVESLARVGSIYRENYKKLKGLFITETKNISKKVSDFIYEKFLPEIKKYQYNKTNERIIESLKITLQSHGVDFDLPTTKLENKLEDVQYENFLLKKKLELIGGESILETFSGDIAAPEKLLGEDEGCLECGDMNEEECVECDEIKENLTRQGKKIFRALKRIGLTEKNICKEILPIFMKEGLATSFLGPIGWLIDQGSDSSVEVPEVCDDILKSSDEPQGEKIEEDDDGCPLSEDGVKEDILGDPNDKTEYDPHPVNIPEDEEDEPLIQESQLDIDREKNMLEMSSMTEAPDDIRSILNSLDGMVSSPYKNFKTSKTKTVNENVQPLSNSHKKFTNKEISQNTGKNGNKKMLGESYKDKVLDDTISYLDIFNR